MHLYIKKKIITVLTAALLSACTQAAAFETGAAPSTDAYAGLTLPDSIRVPHEIKTDWRTLLRGRRLVPQDTSVNYPRFLRFCLGVYRWAEKNFNTYDPDYVAGLGQNGKVRLISDNWTDTYYFKSQTGAPLLMVSNPYCNLGIQANYSVLSLGYSVDLNSVAGSKEAKHKKLVFSVSCARLYGEAYFWENKGGTVIRKFGNDPTDGNNIRNYPFEGMRFKAFGAIGMYIFNYRKFSLPAAYDLSMRQVRSAGSWMAGISGTFYDCDFDFTMLPEEIKEHTRLPELLYTLEYNSVNLMGGYSFNWVCNRHFLFNTTTMPGIGVSFSFSRSTPGRKELFSTTIRQMFSLTYTNRSFFAAGTSTFHGNMLFTDDIGFMSGIFNFQISAGIRF